MKNILVVKVDCSSESGCASVGSCVRRSSKEGSVAFPERCSDASVARDEIFSPADGSIVRTLVGEGQLAWTAGESLAVLNSSTTPRDGSSIASGHVKKG